VLEKRAVVYELLGQYNDSWKDIYSAWEIRPFELGWDKLRAIKCKLPNTPVIDYILNSNSTIDEQFVSSSILYQDEDIVVNSYTPDNNTAFPDVVDKARAAVFKGKKFSLVHAYDVTIASGEMNFMVEIV
jgi:hypothetical protein